MHYYVPEGRAYRLSCHVQRKYHQEGVTYCLSSDREPEFRFVGNKWENVHNSIRQERSVCRRSSYQNSYLREKLSVSSTGSEIVIRNHLLELREDANLVEVTEEGDTLTAFKRRIEADDDIEEADDFFVVILSSVTKELVFLRPGEAAQLQLQEVAHNQIISVFRCCSILKKLKIFEYSLQERK